MTITFSHHDTNRRGRVDTCIALAGATFVLGIAVFSAGRVRASAAELERGGVVAPVADPRAGATVKPHDTSPGHELRLDREQCREADSDAKQLPPTPNAPAQLALRRG